jgi:hypothetical protein
MQSTDCLGRLVVRDVRLDQHFERVDGVKPVAIWVSAKSCVDEIIDCGARVVKGGNKERESISRRGREGGNVMAR